MLEAWNSFATKCVDLLLGWSLYLPRDVVLLLVSLLTALALLGVRRWTTNQDWLRRAQADRKRLGQLLREAKREGDRQQAARYRATSAMIAWCRLKAEGLPLLLSLPPLALLGTWAMFRLGYLPPEPGDQLAARLYTPTSAISRVAHLVPRDGIACDGWVQAVGEDTLDGEVVNGIATWTIICGDEPRDASLAFRLGEHRFEHPLTIGGAIHSQPLQFHGPRGQYVTEVALPEYRLLGILPGIPWLMIPPWVTGYLLLVLPITLILRRVLRIE